MSGPVQRRSERPNKATNGHSNNDSISNSDVHWIWSPNPERRIAEQFFLQWSVIWVSIMAYIVATRWFETFTPWHYMIVGLTFTIIPIIVPLFFPKYFLSSHLSVSRRYTSKANLYIVILAWVSNYFWTHYFYSVLHATYTFDAHRLNDVPFALYLITHSYFHLYHVLSSMLMRVIWRVTFSLKGTSRQICAFFMLFIACYIVAFLETFTIQNFPYYDIPDRRAMYVYGSLFYALYFMISFPMFARLDEQSNNWSFNQTFLDAAACCMIITQLLDLWRITIGQVTDEPAANPPKHSVPFVY